MKRLVFLLLMVSSLAFAEGKPELGSAVIVAFGLPCPDNKGVCFFLSQGDRFFIVRGEGYGKEEKIWEYKNKKSVLLWQSLKGMT